MKVKSISYFIILNIRHLSYHTENLIIDQEISYSTHTKQLVRWLEIHGKRNTQIKKIKNNHKYAENTKIGNNYQSFTQQILK